MSSIKNDACRAQATSAVSGRTTPRAASQMSIDSVHLARFVDKTWDAEIVPTLQDFVRIPNKSQDFDKQWIEHGHMEKAVSLISGWCEKNAPPGTKVEVVRLEGRSPLIFMDIPAEGAEGGKQDDVVLMYGHLDKQPEMKGWSEGLGPWTPVLRDDKLYGRGGADDGYAAFASVTALRALHEQKIAHARCVVLIEAGEESGSPDLEAYVDHLSPRIGSPSLVVCLDSGCGDYKRLWSTTSLRGMVGGTLRVDMLTEGVHSGDASGVVASPFRVTRQLLDRLEDARSGKVLVPECHTEIPAERLKQVAALTSIFNTAQLNQFPFVRGATAASQDGGELMLNRSWRPALSYTGADGLPPIENAGNVLLPFTALKLSMRLPPTVDSERALAAVKRTLEQDPPYGAHVSFNGDHATGWNAPPTAPWLKQATEEASQTYFGNEAAYMGEGGSIPFINMLGQRFPQAQFLITGVLGPNSNAHGPNEFLHIPTGKKLTSSVAHIVARHHQRQE